MIRALAPDLRPLLQLGVPVDRSRVVSVVGALAAASTRPEVAERAELARRAAVAVAEPATVEAALCGALLLLEEMDDLAPECSPASTVIEWGAQLSEGLTLLRAHTLPALLRALVAAGPEGAALSAAPLEELAKKGRQLAEELGTLAGAVAHLAGAQQRAAEYWQSLRRAVADDQSPAPAECSP